MGKVSRSSNSRTRTLRASIGGAGSVGPPPDPPVTHATGGTITDDGVEWTYHTFTAGGTFTPDAGTLVVEYVVVGGGGGGGSRRSGGGGGGSKPVTGAGLSLTSAQAITIGTGGAGGIGTADGTRHGAAGTASSLGAHATAPGGGYGAGGGTSGSDPGGGGSCGGGGGTSGTNNGGAGGSGVVVIRYRDGDYTP
jgi:hypothetical protein